MPNVENYKAAFLKHQILGDNHIELIAGPDLQGRLYVEVFLEQLHGGMSKPDSSKLGCEKWIALYAEYPTGRAIIKKTCTACRILRLV